MALVACLFFCRFPGKATALLHRRCSVPVSAFGEAVTGEWDSVCLTPSFWNSHSITASQAGLNFWIFLYSLPPALPQPSSPSFRKRCCLQNEPPFPGPSPKLPAPTSPLNTRSLISPNMKKSFVWGQRMGRIPGNRTRRQK